MADCAHNRAMLLSYVPALGPPSTGSPSPHSLRVKLRHTRGNAAVVSARQGGSHRIRDRTDGKEGESLQLEL